MGRHIDAWLSGEETDPVDGTHHLGNVMACCAILLDAQACGKLIDDRPPSASIRPAYKALENLAAKLKEQYADKRPRHCTIADTETCFGTEDMRPDCAPNDGRAGFKFKSPSEVAK
jgi:hypothetical protein